MKKLKYILLSLLLLPVFLLSSCSSESFYSNFKSLGATIEETNCFEEITLDQAVAKKNAKESFVLVIVSSKKSASATAVTAIQYDADNTNYTGKVLVLDVKSPTAEEGHNIETKLQIKAHSDSNGFVAVGFNNGAQIFDTSKNDVNSDVFRTTSDAINIHAVFTYIAEGVISKTE